MKPSAYISEADLATATGFSTRWLRELAAKNLIPPRAKAGYPMPETAWAIVKHLKGGKSAKGTLDEEKLRKTRLEADKLEREKEIAEGRLLTLELWQHLVTETIPPWREWLRATMKTELPATLAGRTEPEIRAVLTKKYNQGIERLQGYEEKFHERPAEIPAQSEGEEDE